MFWQACSGTILNNRAVLAAAHCITDERLHLWRVRVGTSYPNAGGAVHEIQRHIVHPLYTSKTMEHNIAIIHVVVPFTFSNLISPASIAGPNYSVADNQGVIAIGWGWGYSCTPSLWYSDSKRFPEIMREVPLLTTPQETCRDSYAPLGIAITDNMLCAGWPVDNRGHCAEDSGAPLLHNRVVIGVFAFRFGISDPEHPSNLTRVSNYTSWITSNA
ncbi:trypsin, alkaline C-like [Spodoptera frugiperda]|uniref:Trypsin, alkaline C-like n=1 Tax=Spodoptera frugiperda TaxID=7108 RepID=A0A9R0DX35_SPOFR|nr:trypsin, alkaline C-like [Spodoptera frugiperda]